MTDTTIIVAGTVTVLAALTTSITSIIAAVRSGRAEAAVAETKEKVGGQEKKLDKITGLVNGGRLLILQELADVRRLLASSSGLASDDIRAKAAQDTADAQAASVSTSNEQEEP